MLSNSLKPRAFLVLLYFAAVIASSFYTDLKYRSLNFHTRDYAFYLQFSSKLLDPHIAKTYSLNPEGFNWLRFSGTEGAGNFHRALHFEPIKYVYAALYYFAKTPRALFWFTSLLYFLPLVYLALTSPRTDQFRVLNGTGGCVRASTGRHVREGSSLILVVALLYVLFPAALMTPSFDLRPYVFLAPFFFMSLIAVRFQRPLWERLLCFNCMFLAREEALLLAIPLILLQLTIDDEPGLRKRSVLALSLSWLAWVSLTLGFFKWTGYHSSLFEQPWNLLQILVLCGVGLLVLGVLSLRKLRPPAFSRRRLQIAAYSSVFIPLAFHFFSSEVPDSFSPTLSWLIQTLCTPRYSLYFVATLGLLLFWREGRAPVPSKWQLGLAASVLLTFLGVGMFALAGIVRTGIYYQRQIAPAREVFALRNSTDKYLSCILVDYQTHQAFADYQNVFVYNRLPWEMAPGEGRYYPANSQIVQTLIKDRIEYVVLSKESAEDVNGFLINPQNTVPLFETERFVALKLIRQRE
jgi:hypothetical protein